MTQKTANAKAAAKIKNGGPRLGVQRSGRKTAPIRELVPGRVLFWSLGLGVFLLLSTLITMDLVPPGVSYQAGDIAQRNVKAPKDMRVIDSAATESLRQSAREKVKPRYDIDSKQREDLRARISGAFDAIQKALSAQAAEARKRLDEEAARKSGKISLSESRVYAAVFRSPGFRKAEENFSRQIGGKLNAKLRAWLRGERYSARIRDDLIKLATAAISRGVVSDRRLYNAHRAKGIVIRDIRTGGHVSLTPSANPLELRQLERFLIRQAPRLDLQTPPKFRRLLVSLAAQIVPPTFTFNNQATVKAQLKAAAKVKPVMQLIKRGEMIVREGERITKVHLAKLKGLERTARQDRVLDNFAGTAIVVSLFLFLAWICAERYQLSVLKDNSQFLLFLILLASQAVIVKVGIGIAYQIQQSFSAIGVSSFYYTIPFAAGPLLAALLQGRSPAILMAAMTAVLTGLLLPGQENYVLVAFAGGTFAALRWKEYRQRSSIVITGLLIGLLNAALAFGMNMQQGFHTAVAHFADVPFAVLGGFVNLLVVSAAMPLLESIFKLTTDMRLLELADQNHPLLRQLVVRAPGTYHHSLIVGNLAEEAAEAVGANPLLTRVGAYYHDIGKILKPEYFIENQNRENRHDRLSPSMSALILISHVKDGVDLGRSHKLPNEILDFISQHHGTSLIRYFYDKAKSQGAHGEEIPEAAFRYPGPRPKTREAGIVMLADMVEATARTLNDPTPGRLAGMVERIVQSAFVDGQLDGCDLTLKDIGRIEESILRVLAGIHHHRVIYPEKPEKALERKGSHEGHHIKPAKTGSARP